MPSIHNIVGIAGVLLIVAAYLLLQAGKLSVKNIWYSLMNLVGALLITYSLFFDWNLSAFVIEIFWLLISTYGIIRYFRSARKE